MSIEEEKQRKLDDHAGNIYGYGRHGTCYQLEGKGETHHAERD